MINSNSPYDDRPPIRVRFPLEGEWLAVNTPGTKIPSHGTDFWGQRFAYDFLTPHDMQLAGTFLTGLRYWLGGGIPLAKSTSWKKPILSPIQGKVIAARDGWPDPKTASPLDLFRLIGLGLGLRGGEKTLRKDMRLALGNYLIVEGSSCWAFIAHAATGSIQANEGDEVIEGQHIANVGHTGNSTQPHLHFHLMDGPDLWIANGLPCCFESYEQLNNGKWRLVENGIPGNKDVIRSVVG